MERSEYERLLNSVGERAVEIAQIKRGVEAARYARELANKHYSAMVAKLEEEQRALYADLKQLTDDGIGWPFDNPVVAFGVPERKQ